MEIKSSLLNSKDLKLLKNSLIAASEVDGKENFRVRLIEYIDDTADNEDDEFFYDMIEFCRFLKPDPVSPAINRCGSPCDRSQVISFPFLVYPMTITT